MTARALGRSPGYNLEVANGGGQELDRPLSLAFCVGLRAALAAVGRREFLHLLREVHTDSVEFV
jgi:hypothetical protein